MITAVTPAGLSARGRKFVGIERKSAVSICPTRAKIAELSAPQRPTLVYNGMSNVVSKPFRLLSGYPRKDGAVRCNPCLSQMKSELVYTPNC